MVPRESGSFETIDVEAEVVIHVNGLKDTFVCNAAEDSKVVDETTKCEAIGSDAA